MNSTSTTLVQIPASPSSTLKVDKLEEILEEAFKSLKGTDYNIKHLQEDIMSAKDDGQTWSGENVDRAVNCVDDDVRINRAHSCSKYASRLKEAIEKIQTGRFDDHCTQCGGIIPLKRLLVAPETRHCVPCKQNRKH